MRRRSSFALLFLLSMLVGPALKFSNSFRLAAYGRVFDGSDPVEETCLRFQAHSWNTWTDSAGFYQLPRPGRGKQLTASKEGYLIACASSGSSIQLPRLPQEDWEEYAWVDPSPSSVHADRCGNCHPEIYREWSESGHARLKRSSRFLNLYEGTDWHGKPGVGWNLLGDHPAGAAVCNACHAPAAPFDIDLRDVNGTTGGVHCDFCHKVVGAQTTQVGYTHGRYGLDLLRPRHGQLFFGPLDDVDRQEDSYSPLYRQSRYCASCHEGVIFGIQVYSTYSEWLSSPARHRGQQCQSCHMAPTGHLTNVAPGKGGIERNPMTLASHQFPGGEREMLRRCLRLSVELVKEGSGIQARVNLIAQGVGHRVPTGFVDRNLVLLVEGFDHQGHMLQPIGPTLPPPAGKEMAGKPGRLYAKQLQDLAGTSPVPFWRALPEFNDTRLKPEQPDTIDFRVPPNVQRLRIQLIYRRFWPEVAASKQWPADAIHLVDKELSINSIPSANSLKSLAAKSDIPQ
jgi:hypothetical protein